MPGSSSGPSMAGFVDEGPLAGIAAAAAEPTRAFVVIDGAADSSEFVVPPGIDPLDANDPWSVGPTEQSMSFPPSDQVPSEPSLSASMQSSSAQPSSAQAVLQPSSEPLAPVWPAAFAAAAAPHAFVAPALPTTYPAMSAHMLHSTYQHVGNHIAPSSSQASFFNPALVPGGGVWGLRPQPPAGGLASAGEAPSPPWTTAVQPPLVPFWPGPCAVVQDAQPTSNMSVAVHGNPANTFAQIRALRAESHAVASSRVVPDDTEIVSEEPSR